MKPEPVLLAAALALGALAALPAGAAEKKPAAKCFAPEQITSHKVGDARTLFFKAGGGVYRVDMTNNCLGGVTNTDPLTIAKSASAAGGVCAAEDLDIRAELGGGGLPSHCRIDKLTRLTPAQVSALPKDQQP